MAKRQETRPLDGAACRPQRKLLRAAAHEGALYLRGSRDGGRHFATLKLTPADFTQHLAFRRIRHGVVEESRETVAGETAIAGLSGHEDRQPHPGAMMRAGDSQRRPSRCDDQQKAHAFGPRPILHAGETEISSWTFLAAIHRDVLAALRPILREQHTS